MQPLSLIDYKRYILEKSGSFMCFILCEGLRKSGVTIVDTEICLEYDRYLLNIDNLSYLIHKMLYNTKLEHRKTKTKNIDIEKLVERYYHIFENELSSQDSLVDMLIAD